ncbi:MAG: response regulator [Methanoregula sp.]|nr:response regulator [Methanoregula sp.]
MVRWIEICCLAIIVAGIFCMPIAGALPVPDYQKNLQLHVNYVDGKYSISGMEVKYGQAPNLNIKSGNLKGVILGTNGKELKSFSLQAPGIAYGDIISPQGGESLIGYTERPALSEMVITLPYMTDMQQFSLSDSQAGSLLISADLNPSIMSFCSDYSSDPDCLARSVPVKSSVPDSGLSFMLATVFSASVIIAAGLAIMTLRRRAAPHIPEKKTILIADDEPEIVDMIHLLLNKKGYATIKAHSGKECLDALKKQIPDLILLDVRMEPMDGWQTLEQIKKNPESSSIPVLMLTGNKISAASAKQYQIVIDDYIMKPFQPADLYAAIDQILMRKQKVRESLELVKKAGVDKEMFCEFAKLTHRISVNKKIMDVLQVPQAIPMLADMDMLDNMSVADYISIKTRDQEKRALQLRQEINSTFRSKGFPELSL